MVDELHPTKDPINSRVPRHVRHSKTSLFYEFMHRVEWKLE